jgi:hypothetical protein
VPLPNQPETEGVPVSTTTDGEGDGGKLGETPPTPPVEAGTGSEDPESLPSERPESVPPPPPGRSTEGDDVPRCPRKGNEGEAAQAGAGNAPAVPDPTAESDFGGSAYILPAL